MGRLGEWLGYFLSLCYGVGFCRGWDFDSCKELGKRGVRGYIVLSWGFLFYRLFLLGIG